MAVSPQNAIRGVACGLVAFSLMLLGFCAYAASQVSMILKHDILHQVTLSIHYCVCLMRRGHYIIFHGTSFALLI